MALKHKFKTLVHARRIVPKYLWDILKDLDERIGDGGKNLTTSVASGPGYTQNQLNQAFGLVSEIPIEVAEKFVGIYTNTNDGKKYLVTISDGEYKGIAFNTIT